MKVQLNIWREISVLMLIFMEVSWITPWFRSLTPETYAIEPLRILLTLAIIIMFSYLLIRSMDYLKLKKKVRQVIMVIFLFLGCFVGIKTLLYVNETVPFVDLLNHQLRSFVDLTNLIPVEFIIIVIVLIAFWIGISFAQEYIGPSTILNHFWMGIVMFVAFFFLTTIVTGEQPGEFFFLFLFSTLAGISTARMTVIGLLRGGTEVVFNRAWFIGILFTAFSVAGLGSVIGVFLGNQMVEIGTLFVGLLGSILVIIWFILNPLLATLVRLAEKILKDSEVMANMGQTLEGLNNFMSTLREKLAEDVYISGIVAFFARIAPVLKAVILILIILLIVAAILYWMTMKFWKERDRKLSAGEEKNSLTRMNLWQSLIDLFIKGYSNTRNSFTEWIDFRHRQRVRAAARIRQIYGEFLELCETLGEPRPNALTPLEFEPQIEQILPDCKLEISQITQAYLQVRYGLLPETPNEVTLVETAWNKISAFGHEFIKNQKRNKNI